MSYTTALNSVVISFSSMCRGLVEQIVVHVRQEIGQLMLEGGVQEGLSVEAHQSCFWHLQRRAD